MTQAALATHAHLEGATITHHVDRLEKAGLVRRVLDPDDRRVRRLELTPAGVELHARMMTAVDPAPDRGAWPGSRQDDREVMRSLRSTLIQANLAALRRSRSRRGRSGRARGPRSRTSVRR